MRFFGDFRNAIDVYATDKDVRLVGYQVLGTGTRLNPGEWLRCPVQVLNNGELNLKEGTVGNDSKSDASASLTQSHPAASVIAPFGNMLADSSKQCWIDGSATAATSGAQDVIRQNCRPGCEPEPSAQ